MSVRGVVFASGVDRSDALNAAALQHDVPARLLVAQAIAESNLTESAERWGFWPDVSFGPFQQTVAYAPIGDHTSSLTNVEFVRRRFTEDFEFALDVAAQQLGHYWAQYGPDGPEVMARYNWPSRGLAGNPNARHIHASWQRSAEYEATTDGEPEDDTWRPTDVRDQFPYRGCEFAERPLSAITQVIYHHGASRTPQPTAEDELALMQEYADLHVGKGWCTLSYHVCIGPSGTAYWANGLNLISYHALQANSYSVGICFLGNYEHEAPSDAMLATAVRVRRWAARQCGRDDLPYVGHRDVVQTSCPGGWWDPDLLRERPDEPIGPEPEPAPEEDDMALVAELQRIAEEEVIRNIEKALDVPRLPRAAREALRYGALPAAQTIARGGAEA